MKENKQPFFIKAGNRINIPKEVLRKMKSSPLAYNLHFLESTGEIILVPIFETPTRTREEIQEPTKTVRKARQSKEG